MTYTRHNHIENLALDYEHDSAYEDFEIDQADLEAAAQTKLILQGETFTGVLEDCSYISVDPQYFGELSVGQRRLYEILLSLQESAIYSVTTIGRLTQAMDLKNPLACGKRLENLQALGVISGFRG
ncbi:hypothetical protein [Almyronema epifaneia]|uniref:Uncharacterized protein n=1 Tax=Almyronema epifaneia S1 TaxID=2991925 RepID=A0ABW6IJN2_9CYAN